VDVIAETVTGIGHFLGNEQTLRLMRTEFRYPELADRSAPGAWEEEGSPAIVERAHERVREILSTHYPAYIGPALDAEIRSRFPIRLAEADMQPGGARW
jgi:trimethylamine--corrinoid protein Co-methyltransferase